MRAWILACVAVVSLGCGRAKEKEREKAKASFDAYLKANYPGTKWSTDQRTFDSCEYSTAVTTAEGVPGFIAVIYGKAVSWYPEDQPIVTTELTLKFSQEDGEWKCSNPNSKLTGGNAEILPGRACSILNLMCAGKAAAKPKWLEKPSVAYPDSTEGLEREFKEFLATWTSKDGDRARALMGSLHLPNPSAFFKTTWGDVVGTRLAAEYAQNASGMDELQKIVMKLADNGLTEVKVQRFEKPNDPDETKYQSEALRAMQKPVPIYSVRITKPGETLGQHFYSFVYLDGTFRLMGKTKRLVEGALPSKEVDALAELRIRDAKQFLATGKIR